MASAAVFLFAIIFPSCESRGDAEGTLTISKRDKERVTKAGVLTGMSNEKLRNRMEYFVACVREFAQAHGLSHPAAFDYLDRYQGMTFLVKCYEAEHTVSFADAVDDLGKVCRRHGGRL